MSILYFFGIEYFSAKSSFWAVYLALEALHILISNSEWGRFAAMLIFLQKQLIAFLLQHIGARKTSLAANHTF